MLMMGTFCTALFSSVLSVYVFHDVDKSMVGHWNQAFLGSCTEGVLFTLIVGGGVALFVLLGRLLFSLKGYSPRTKLAALVGIGVTVLQYPWDYFGRATLPKFADSLLGVYLVVAVIFCSIVLIRDSLDQKKLHQPPTSSG
jgi:hypothetical protein